MKIWTIWVDPGTGDPAWLEAAWDDLTTVDNESGWHEEVERVRKLAADNDGYEYRIVAIEVPYDEIIGAFEAPVVEGRAGGHR